MNDIVFNIPPIQGPTIPTWVPFIGGFLYNSPIIGSFLGVFIGFMVNWIWQSWNSKRLHFEEEYHIKAELSSIKHDLTVGGIHQLIKPLYGANHVREYRLFGEHRTEVINWYEGFQRYNLKLEELMEQRTADVQYEKAISQLERAITRRERAITRFEWAIAQRKVAIARHKEAIARNDHEVAKSVSGLISAGQSSMANQIGGMLSSGWLKKIPDDTNNSGLSKTKFMWYLLRQDALKEPTGKRDFQRAIINKVSRNVHSGEDEYMLFYRDN